MKYVRSGILILLSAVLLGGCGDSSAGNEEFVDSGEAVSSFDSYQDLVDKIIADETVTRAESEQAVDQYVKCLTENYITGEITVDYDLDPWTTGGSYTLSSTAPGYDQLPEDNGKSYPENPFLQQYDAMYQKYAGQCSMFEHQLNSFIASHSDMDMYQRRQYDKKVQCIATNAPRYADRIDPSWAGLDDRFHKLNEEFKSETTAQGSDDQRSALQKCLYTSLGRTITFGTP